MLKFINKILYDAYIYKGNTNELIEAFKTNGRAVK